jgi:hypothetical protein
VGHHSVRSGRRFGRFVWWLTGALTVVVALGLLAYVVSRPGARPTLAEEPQTFTAPPLTSPGVPPVSRKSRPPLTTAPPKPAGGPSPCLGSTDAQRVIVSIAEQHAWVCSGAHQIRDSAVTTGMVSAGGTPTGTWHIQAKETDRWLASGGESYKVKYWMPYNGDYGFHDALWQKFPFGGAQYRTDGSHGCVHFPLDVMAWLYTWMQVGSTVTVQA